MRPKLYKTFDEWFAIAHLGTPPLGSRDTAKGVWDAAIRTAYECVAEHRFAYIERKEYDTAAAVRDAAWKTLNELASEECVAAIRREAEDPPSQEIGPIRATSRPERDEPGGGGSAAA